MPETHRNRVDEIICIAGDELSYGSTIVPVHGSYMTTIFSGSFTVLANDRQSTESTVSNECVFIAKFLQERVHHFDKKHVKVSYARAHRYTVYHQTNQLDVAVDLFDGDSLFPIRKLVNFLFSSKKSQLIVQ